MSLWIKNVYLKCRQSLRICMRLNHNNCKGTSFYICHKASLTVEAAVVVPVMIGFLACVLFFFRVLSVQVSVEEALMYAGRKVAVESCIINSPEAMFLSTEVYLLEALEESDIVSQHVIMGKYGIRMYESEFSGKEIILRAEYDVRLPVRLFAIDRLHLSSANRFEKWQGVRMGEVSNQWVYITPSGRAYHKDLSCRTLDLSIHEVSIVKMSKIRGSDGQKYYPCEECDTTKSQREIVYYTDYGTRYHGEISCSALKRSIRKVLLTEIGDKKACRFCYP